MKTLLGSMLAAAAFLGLTAFAAAQAKPAEATARPAAQESAVSKEDAAKILAQKGAYPLKKCPISGEELGAKAIDTLVDGRLVRVCCNDCVAGATKDKEKIFKAIDAAVIEQQAKAYPLEKCPISGEKLGEGAVNYVHGTYLIRFCCKDCVASFKKSPDATMKKLETAYIASQRAKYPLDTCIVSGEELGGMGEPIDYLWGTHLYRLCCGGCKKAIQKDPEGNWAKIEAARAAKKEEKKG